MDSPEKYIFILEFFYISTHSFHRMRIDFVRSKLYNRITAKKQISGNRINDSIRNSTGSIQISEKYIRKEKHPRLSRCVRSG